MNVLPSVRPELVEGLYSTFNHASVAGQGFDKLSPKGGYGAEFVA